MKTLTIFLLTLIYAIHSQGQTVLKGTVKSILGETIPGVNVYLKGTYDGTTTDVKGNFIFTTGVKGDHILVIQGMGFKTQEKFIDMEALQSEYIFTLKEAFNELMAVTISAGAMEASDEKKAVVLRPIDIVTTPSAMGDIIAAFQTLPGTSTVGNDGRLFVRGGDASETAIFIDGMKVGNAFGTTANNVPTRTRFSPNLFKGSFFSTGGYSAEYGQALSSALALNTLDNPIRNQGDISLLSIGMGYTQTLVGDKNSLTASVNYFDLAPYQSLINQHFNWERSPYGWDAEVSARQKWGKNGMVKAYVHSEAGGMQLWQPLPGKEGPGQLIKVNNQYTFAQTSFKQTGQKEWIYYGGLSYSDNDDRIVMETLHVNQKSRLTHGKLAGVKSFSDRVSLKTGAETYIHYYNETVLEDGLQRNYLDQQYNLFSELDYYISHKLVFRGGLRSGYSTLADEYWLDPRISLAYKFDNEGQISVAAGQFSQLPLEQQRVINPELQNTKADHLILNYFISKEGRTLRAEAFYKGYDHLVTFEGIPRSPTNIQQEGEGYAQGFDLFYRDQKTLTNTDFWITYSLIESRRKFAQFQTAVQPGFAPRHNGSIVVKHFITALKSQLGSSLTINDGYTYTDPNTPGEMNSKTKSFQNLSISWSYLPKPNLIIHLACSNVLGRDNVFGHQFSTAPNDSGRFESLPIRQGAPRFIFLGIFLTLSKDKTANQLNNL
ncbi:TonB-dependent receptor [Anditalea andensis]|uniref:TonB-dependent receptor n=1 Tax=Anditalea andensis TaxID=1048983 RepID=A0A074LE69_9BACT|nr:TonB-dependent receptor [Anditalea andensis]KEO72077.1 TonB-dependent receptor [Anditalea andensis]